MKTWGMMELNPCPKLNYHLCVTKFRIHFFTLSLGFLIDTYSPSILFNHSHQRPLTFCPVIRETVQISVFICVCVSPVALP